MDALPGGFRGMGEVTEKYEKRHKAERQQVSMEWDSGPVGEF